MAEIVPAWFVFVDRGKTRRRGEEAVVVPVVANAGNFARHCRTAAFLAPELVNCARRNFDTLSGRQPDLLLGLNDPRYAVDIYNQGRIRCLSAAVRGSELHDDRAALSPVYDVLSFGSVIVGRSALAFGIQNEFFSIGLRIRLAASDAVSQCEQGSAYPLKIAVAEIRNIPAEHAPAKSVALIARA